MSHTELERLARIRMQLTGETLERAMAVLEGHAADLEPDPNGDHGTPAPATEPPAEPPADQATDRDPDQASGADAPRPRHLRGL